MDLIYVLCLTNYQSLCFLSMELFNITNARTVEMSDEKRKHSISKAGRTQLEGNWSE